MFHLPVKTKGSALLAGILLLSLAAPLRSEKTTNARGDDSINTVQRYTTIDLKLKQYRFDAGQSIVLHFRVTNSGYQTMRIYPFEPAEKTYQFEVLDEKGFELKPMTPEEGSQLDLERKAVVNLAGQHVREIILQPGESFERKIDLTKYYNLRPGQTYRVTGYFFPDARHNIFLRSRDSVELHINSEKSKYVFQKPELQQEEDGLSPEETVYLFLSAEMRRNWKNYLKYLDLPRYITSYDRFSGRYASASPADRAIILQEFSRYLTSDPTDQLRRFRILTTKRSEVSDRAEVTVEALRMSGGYRVAYEYTYTLERARQEGFWKIIHVVARVL
ncbi:MAG: hypothetical protein KDK37_15080 [Leptospiraceae bacterium]|nr:hypothetical protein [Leptospiraceae bacterium]